MKKFSFWAISLGALTIFFVIFSWAGTTEVSAGTLTETLEKFLNEDIAEFTQNLKLDTFELMPIRSAFVKGDAARFRAMTWINDGSVSGIKEITFHDKINEDTMASFEGTGMFGDADYGGDLLVTKEDVGYIKMGYKTFRKYFENRGGYFPSFPSAGMDLHILSRELELDIGQFAIELGKGSPGDPNFSLGYERYTRNGRKSTLNWAYAKDAAFGTATANQRKITPSFYEKDEPTDTLIAKGKMEVSGFTVRGEQKYSFFDGNTLNQEQLYSAATTASENKIVQQREMPQTKELSTTLRAERWTLNDKTYMSMGYRFGHLRNTMVETERDYNSATGALLTGGRFRNGVAKNNQDTHTMSGQLLSNLTDKLTFISRFKGEVRSIHSSSYYDTLNISEAVTATTRQENENNITSSAESFSLRYSGLPKTSVYTDLELKQERNWKSQDVSPSTFAEAVNRVPEGTGTIGARFSPTRTVSLTTEWKHHEKNDKLDQVTGSSQAYINKLRTTSDSLSSRLSWKPVRWLENSVRVKTLSEVYHIQVLNLNESKMPVSERNFVYNAVFTPTEKWLFDLSFALKLLKTGGIGSQYSYAPPPFTGNVYTWTFSTSYAPTEKFSLFNTLEYSRAHNKTNADSDTFSASSTGPLLWGVDEEWYNIDTGLSWVLKKDVTIEPRYSYQTFHSFDGIETGNYSAHVVTLEAKLAW